MTNRLRAEAALERVKASIDKGSIAAIAERLVAIPSVTGHEEGVGRELESILEAVGMDVYTQQVEDGRSNVIGVVQGKGGGRSLMLNGHLDTEVRGDEDLWRIVGSPGEYPPLPRRDGDWLKGLGSYNMKGALAAFSGATQALLEGGIELRGDLIIAGVVGENGRAQVSGYQGRQFRGGGVGTQHLVTHGCVADAAIVGEPTDLSVVRGHMGNVWLRIDVITSVPHINDAGREDNAVWTACRLIDRLSECDDALAMDFQDEVVTGESMQPHIRISAIEGGWPFRLSQNPGMCSVYVDGRFRPEQHARDLVARIREVIRLFEADFGCRCRTYTYQSIPGTELDAGHWLVDTVSGAHEMVVGSRPSIERRRYHTDATTLTRYGIPALNYGPSGEDLDQNGTLSSHSPTGEAVRISKVVTAAMTYAATTLLFCGYE